MGRKSRLAVELLANELFNNLVAEMRQDYFQQWVDSTSLDEREDIFHRMTACDDIMNLLQLTALETSR